MELIHGQLPSKQKAAAMEAFARGEADVLVATSVIEVGIDVPNATVMLIEAAERYGLSQLHQLRGRVGRGEHGSVCILFGDPKLPRLEALAGERDGFRLAEIDLELRGAGDVLGTRQHGLPEFRVARLPEDAELLVRARDRADAILLDGPAAGGARARAPARRGRGTLRVGAGPDSRMSEMWECWSGGGVRVVAGSLQGTPPGCAARRARRARPPTACARRCSRCSADVEGARVLDLYAGSGALGIEALSRGAASAVFVDATPAPSPRSSATSSRSAPTRPSYAPTSLRYLGAVRARSISCSATLPMILRPAWPVRSPSSCRRSPQRTPES